MVAGLGACSSPLPSGICATSITYTTTYTTAVNNDLDLVFVIDDGAAMAGWQAQLATQLPTFMAVLQSHAMPMGLPRRCRFVGPGRGGGRERRHPGLHGVRGRRQPSQSAGSDVHRHDPRPGGDLHLRYRQRPQFHGDGRRERSRAWAKVFQCIAHLGDSGCGFGQPLAALDRALGADGQPPPAANAGFLRPDAYLGIVIISNRDDCSVPAGSTLFSDDPAQGLLTHYRCNHAGHVCSDANGNQVAPPIHPPADAVSIDGVSTVSLTNCASNETGSELTPISKIVADIKSLKPDPDNQILVSALDRSSDALRGRVGGQRRVGRCRGAQGLPPRAEPRARMAAALSANQPSGSPSS